MAAKKKYMRDDNVSDYPTEAPSEPTEDERVTNPRTTKSAVRVNAKAAKRVTFDVYARRKLIKKTHIPGMRAFTKNPNVPRTLEEWDKFFESY